MVAPYWHFRRCQEPSISDGKDVHWIDTPYGHPVFSRIGNSLDQKKPKKTIRSSTIDHLVGSLSLNPTFIKIDVEGAEYDVLNGMLDTLINFKPTIMIEKHPSLIPKDISIKEIDDFLKANNYILSKEIFSDDLAITEIWKSKNN